MNLIKKKFLKLYNEYYKKPSKYYELLNKDLPQSIFLEIGITFFLIKWLKMAFYLSSYN